MTRSCWVQISRPRPAVRLRLICLPPAGGGASRYRDWPAHFPDDVEIVSVQLPGRENRFHESPIESMEQLVGRCWMSWPATSSPRSRCSATAWAG
ncbi:MAG: thioesterase II family protein [Actinomycetes bacterium]